MMPPESISYSVQGTMIVQIVVSLASIYICWWALQGLKFERFLHEPGGRQAKLLHLILAVILGQQFAGFLLDYVGWTLFS